MGELVAMALSILDQLATPQYPCSRNCAEASDVVRVVSVNWWVMDMEGEIGRVVEIVSAGYTPADL